MKYSKRFTAFFILSVVCFLFLLTHSLWARDNSGSRKYAESFSRTATTVLAPVYRPLAEQIVTDFELAEKEGTGIDLGGGPGSLIIELAKLTNGMHWIIADINPEFFPYVSKSADAAGVGHRIGMIRADAKDLPFRDSYADIIVSRGSFHFWGDLNTAFSEIYRVLKPGGTAFIGRGFSPNLPVNTARIIRFGKDGKGGNSPKYDLDETAENMENIMKALGITDYTIRRPEPPGSEGVNYGIWLEFHKGQSPF